jgi:hypothetical protein
MSGWIPSLHIDYKHSRIKQYFKEGRALRTETTVNDTRDFAIGRRLKNLPALQEIGFAANRRLLHVQKISQDCAVGEDAFRDIRKPWTRRSGLRRARPSWRSAARVEDAGQGIAQQTPLLHAALTAQTY